MRKRIAVLGTPRSGTFWMTDALRSVGLNVNHEGMGPDGTVCGYYAWADNHQGYLPKHGRITPIEFDHTFHLVRHPLRVLRSLPHVMGSQNQIGFAAWWKRMPGIPPGWDKRMGSLVYWVKTTEHLLKRDLPKIYIERIETDWAKIATRIGVPTEVPTVPVRNSIVGSIYEKPIPTWKEIEAINEPWAKRAQQLTTQLGYELGL